MKEMKCAPKVGHESEKLKGRIFYGKKKDKYTKNTRHNTIY